MYSITLVCTHHSEYGKSNSDELYEIIKSLRPDVIFEELPQDLFDKFYKENKIPYEPPEVKSVKRYIKEYEVINIPVDIQPSGFISSNEIYEVFHVVDKFASYSILEEEHKKLVFQGGYRFLNSPQNEEFFEKKKALEKNLIEFQTNKEKLKKIHELFYKEQDIREYEIIKNIYTYSKQNSFNNAVLLIGSGHRKTFFKKLKYYESNSHLKLHWSLYSNLIK